MRNNNVGRWANVAFKATNKSFKLVILIIESDWEGDYMEKKEFYCPVYDGMVEKYDCDEISCGVDLGRFINDGLPFLMPIEEVVRKKD